MQTDNGSKDYWDANLYDGKHSFVSKYGNSLVELLVPKHGEKVLDLGCGTGDLTNKIYEAGVEIVGIDKSENMVKQAIHKFPHLTFVVQDATTLQYMNEFDAVFSNATLHWVHPPIEALKGIYQSLKKDGRFVAEFGGKGNVQNITDEIIRQIQLAGFEYKDEHFPWFYPSIGEYSNLMEEVGFRVTLAQHYDRPTQLECENGLTDWIHMFGGMFFAGIPEQVKIHIIENVTNNLKDILYQDGHWIADYKRIRVVGVK